MTTAAALPIAGLVAVALLVGGCQTPADRATSPTQQPEAILNNVSAERIAREFNTAGLPMLNTHDVSAEACEQAHCESAFDSDTVRILKFAHTGQAQIYAGSVQRSFQLEDAVLVFSPAVSADQRTSYEQVLQKLMR